MCQTHTELSRGSTELLVPLVAGAASRGTIGRTCAATLRVCRLHKRVKIGVEPVSLRLRGRRYAVTLWKRVEPVPPLQNVFIDALDAFNVPETPTARMPRTT